jgi:hypothetical protein
MAPPPVTLPQGLTTAADDRDHRGQPTPLAARSIFVAIGSECRPAHQRHAILFRSSPRVS